MLARLRNDGLALAEPASLFPGPGDAAGESSPLPAGRPISASRDSAWSPDEISGPNRDSIDVRDSQTADRSGGSPAGHDSGSEMLSGEMMSELASRLLTAAERLEQVILRISQPVPGSQASLPRPFRGRVDG